MSEQDQRQVKMFGCTSAELKESVEASPTFKFDGAAMIVASMLSDAQEELGHGYVEEARQTLNRAKFVLFEYLKPARS